MSWVIAKIQIALHTKKVHRVNKDGKFTVFTNDAECPMCKKYFIPCTFGFSHCEWRCIAKIAEGSSIRKEVSPWRVADGGWNVLDSSEESKKKYLSLTTEIRNVIH